MNRNVWLFTGTEKRFETMLDTRDRPFGTVAWIAYHLMFRAIEGFYMPWFSPILRHMDKGLLNSIHFSYVRHGQVCWRYRKQTHFNTDATPGPFVWIRFREGLSEHFVEILFNWRADIRIRLPGALVAAVNDGSGSRDLLNIFFREGLIF
jgi:hypothetical protein